MTTDTPDRGYSLRKPTPTTPAPSLLPKVGAAAGGVAMDERMWGERWVDHAARFSGPAGTAMILTESSRPLIIVSGAGGADAQMDRAVFMAAQFALPMKSSGVMLADETDAWREVIQSDRERQIKARIGENPEAPIPWEMWSRRNTVEIYTEKLAEAKLSAASGMDMSEEITKVEGQLASAIARLESGEALLAGAQAAAESVPVDYALMDGDRRRAVAAPSPASSTAIQMR